MSRSPRVSVLLPVHNGMPYLPEAVNSILGQSFRDFELLLLDDGSTDATPAFALGIDDGRVRYIRLEKVGLVESLNHGLRVAAGGVIARMDGDDIAEPDRLECQYNELRARPQCVLLGCDFDQVGPTGESLEDNPYRLFSDSALRWQMLFCTPFLHPGVMYPREVVQRVGGYRKQFDVAEDYDLWTRLAFAGEVANHPRKLMRKRIHPTAVSVVQVERGVAQSATIAAAYAGRLFPGIEPERIADLFCFYQARDPRSSNPRELVTTFDGLCSRFQEAFSWDEELAAAMASVRQRLRWRCIQRARSQGYDIYKGLSWLTVARHFDPEKGGLLRMAARGARRLLSRAGAHR